MPIKYSNNASTTLNGGISDSDLTITVVDASVFPVIAAPDYTYVTLLSATAIEIVKVTDITGNVLTVLRAQDNTSASAFSSADKCEARICAALLADLQTEAVASAATYMGTQALVYGPGASTDNSLARFDGTTGLLLKDGAVLGVDVQEYDPDTLKADTDDVLACAFGQGYQAIGSLDALGSDTLTITGLTTSNRKSLTVDVAGTIVVTNMAAGAVRIKCTNSGAFAPTLTGVTGTEGTYDSTDAAVNFLLFESDGSTVDVTIWQRSV